MDAATESGEQLVSAVLDDPAVTREDLKQLNQAWEELCQQSVDKQDRLDQARKAAVDFETGLSALMGWIGKQAEALQAQAEPDQDPTTLQQQIEQNKVGQWAGQVGGVKWAWHVDRQLMTCCLLITCMLVRHLLY